MISDHLLVAAHRHLFISSMHRRAMPRLMAARTTSGGHRIRALQSINRVGISYQSVLPGLLTWLLIWLLTMAIKWLLDVIIPWLLYGLCNGFDAS